jgi:tRNA A-37 threonylcarbamoyl transferase component Bud32
MEGLDLVKMRQEAINLRKDYLDLLVNATKDPALIIGQGGAAQVFQFGDTGFCIKVSEKNGPDRLKESAFLERVGGFVVGGVRSPYLLDSMDTPTSFVLVMEQIRGFSLEDVFQGRATLAEDFNFDTFAEKLELYIQKLHETMNMVHGDIAPRNIMVDVQSLNPRVIDFGASKGLRNFKGDERQRLEEKDWSDLGQSLEQLENYIKSRKVIEPKVVEMIVRELNINFGSRIHFNKQIIELIKAQLDNLLISSIGTLLPIPIGDTKLFMSQNEEGLINCNSFVLGGRKIFIGFSKDDLTIGNA